MDAALNVVKGKRITLRVTALFLLTAVLAGCYHVGVIPPPGVNCVAVPMVRNNTVPFQRDFEDALTRALREKIEMQTSLAVVPGEDRADAVLEGTLESFTENVKAEDQLDRAVHSYATARIKVLFRRTGEPGEVFFEDTWTETAHFRTASGIGTAKDEMVRRLTDRVLAMMSTWDG